MVVENLPGDIEEAKDSRITHGIEHVARTLPGHDEVSVPQNRQLLGERALFDSKPGRKITDRNFTFAEGVEYAYP